MKPVALRVTDLTKSFGITRAVTGVSLEVGQGEFHALLGPSGCGKTTLLRLIAGFEIPDQGAVEIDSQRVAGMGSYVPPERRRVGMVFQEYALFPHLSVEGNVAYGLPQGRGRRELVKEALLLVGLAGLESRMPHELSGGQQQRVALARALAPQPRVILMDEPFSNLDPTLRARVRSEVRQILAAAQATVIFVTHDQEAALSLADKVSVMWDGRILQSAPPREVYLRPASREVAAFLGDADFILGEASGGRVVCELGSFPTVAPVEGSVEVMIRPEMVAVEPDSFGPVQVIGRTFYGNHLMFVIRLPSGTILRVRSGPDLPLMPGQLARFTLQGPLTVYPRK